MSALEDEIYKLKSFTKKKEIKEVIEKIGELLQEENQFNIEAQINVGYVDENEINVSDMTWGEDYEVVTGSYNIDGEEFTEDERQERIDELEEEFQNLEDKKMRLHGRAYELVDNKQTRVNDELQELENAEYEYDEIYWNTVWNYYGEVNTELAQRLRFGVLELRDGTEYMFLQGCGMDLSPLLYAYQALEFGRIEEDAVRKFRDPKYFKHVVGEEIFKEVCERLGISHCIDTAIGEQERRMKEFNNKLEALQKFREEGGDEDIVKMGAIAAFLQTQ